MTLFVHAMPEMQKSNVQKDYVQSTFNDGLNTSGFCKAKFLEANMGVADTLEWYALVINTS